MPLERAAISAAELAGDSSDVAVHKRAADAFKQLSVSKRKAIADNAAAYATELTKLATSDDKIDVVKEKLYDLEVIIHVAGNRKLAYRLEKISELDTPEFDRKLGMLASEYRNIAKGARLANMLISAASVVRPVPSAPKPSVLRVPKRGREL